MNIIGCDLSLRSTGLVLVGNEFKHKIVAPSAKQYNDEELLIYNSDTICSFIEQNYPDEFRIESLSLNSISGSKDILWGNYWHLRTEIKKRFPSLVIRTIPVLQWRCAVLSKEEQRQIKECAKLLKQNKTNIGLEKFNDYEKFDYIKLMSQKTLNKKEKSTLKELQSRIGYSTLSKDEKKIFNTENSNLIIGSDIKYQTYIHLPDTIKEEFDASYTVKTGLYDITDAYFIASYKG